MKMKIKNQTKIFKTLKIDNQKNEIDLIVPGNHAVHAHPT